MADDDHLPYIVESRSRIKLKPEAKYWAQEYFGPFRTEGERREGERKMAKHLMRQHALREAGMSERDVIGPQPELSGEEEQARLEAGSPPSPEDLARYEALSGPYSENVEDRRQEAPQLDLTLEKIWGDMPKVAPQAQTWGPNPLANALGFQNVGRRPAPAPQTLGPLTPRWPAAFGTYQRGVFGD